MNDIFYGFLIFFAFVSLVGGLNWLVTAINSWNNDDTTPDLIQHQLKIPADAANVIYIVVFVCTLALFLMVLSQFSVAKNIKKSLTGITGGMR